MRTIGIQKSFEILVMGDKLILALSKENNYFGRISIYMKFKVALVCNILGEFKLLGLGYIASEIEEILKFGVSNLERL